jgi:hypothetical protein
MYVKLIGHRQTDKQTNRGGMDRKGRVDDKHSTKGTRQRDRGAQRGYSLIHGGAQGVEGHAGFKSRGQRGKRAERHTVIGAHGQRDTLS